MEKITFDGHSVPTTLLIIGLSVVLVITKCGYSAAVNCKNCSEMGGVPGYTVKKAGT